jgi:hypothetical protein
VDAETIGEPEDHLAAAVARRRRPLDLGPRDRVALGQPRAEIAR